MHQVSDAQSPEQSARAAFEEMDPSSRSSRPHVQWYASSHRHCDPLMIIIYKFALKWRTTVPQQRKQTSNISRCSLSVPIIAISAAVPKTCYNTSLTASWAFHSRNAPLFRSTNYRHLSVENVCVRMAPAIRRLLLPQVSTWLLLYSAALLHGSPHPFLSLFLAFPCVSIDSISQHDSWWNLRATSDHLLL